ncbi:hypothetical protein IAS59_004864 [Cryptococcus gattii]
MITAITRTALPRTTLRTSLATMSTIRAKHTLPPLPYAYDALEPSISSEIMNLHHTKHHQTYVNGLNAAEESLQKAAAAGDVKAAIALQPALKFNGGGHINHSLFWKNLAPTGSAQVKNLKKEMNAKTAAIQGSGWGWLGYNKDTKKLEIVTTPNQDPLLSHVPIIGIDIWEHAFYLQYKNVKPDYLNAIWDVINYEEAESRLKAAL